MGRKKKKTMKPWCWYCNREFEDEKILLQHQKAKHFKCHICHKKLYTGPGLQIHCMQVHKENIEKVPNSIKGRDNITLEICGMENIPEEDLIEHERQKTISSTRDDESDSDDDRHSNHPLGPPSWAPPVPPPPPPPPPQSQNPQQPPIPPLLPPMPQMANAGSATPPTPGMPPNPAMMQQMMMMYPQMAQMMAMNPMMMQQMMGGMINPPHPSSAPPQPPQPPPPSSAPKPLMSLMEVNPKPMFDSAPKIPKPLFPAAANEYANELKNHQPRLTDLNFVPKVENTLPGSRIIHPEDDISLEEYRASHHKYKYNLPQYSAPPEPTNNAHQHRGSQNPYHHTQMAHNSYGRNGNRYH